MEQQRNMNPFHATDTARVCRPCGVAAGLKAIYAHGNLDGWHYTSKGQRCSVCEKDIPKTYSTEQATGNWPRQLLMVSELEVCDETNSD